MAHGGDGFLTIAYGPPQYVRMALALLASYRRFAPNRPIAVVTDARNVARLTPLFDHVVPIDLSRGHGVVQKLHADLYSPFERTMFVDSDCVFYRSPDELWDLYAQGPFVVRGWRYLTGHSDYERDHPYEWVKDTGAFLRDNGLTRLGHFNSGAFFFDGSDSARCVFDGARDVYRNAATLGFVPFKNAPIADEPALAVAMERCGIEMLPWDSNRGMETAINIERVEEINVLRNTAVFFKSGVRRTPSFLHFNVDAQNSTLYNRELCRLAYGESLPARVLTAALLTRRRIARRVRRIAGR